MPEEINANKPNNRYGKISVIMPVYKVENYLDRAIESVLNQTYLTNHLGEVEFILVDDGSPDRCPEICDKYADRYPFITVIHKENGGLSSARNAGLDIATGDFIAFIDSDDEFMPRMLETCVRMMISYGADIAACHFYNKYDGLPLSKHLPDIETVVLDPYEAVNTLLENRLMTDHVWAKVFRRSAWGGVRFPEGKIYEDITTTYKTFLNARRIVLFSEPLVVYTHRSDSIVGDADAEKRLFLRFERFRAERTRYEDIKTMRYPNKAAAFDAAENYAKILLETIWYEPDTGSADMRKQAEEEAIAFLNSEMEQVRNNPKRSRLYNYRIRLMTQHAPFYKKMILPVINAMRRLRKKLAGE